MTTTLSESMPLEWTGKRLKYAAPLRIERANATTYHSEYLGLENIQSWTGKLLPSKVGEQAIEDDSNGGTGSRFQKNDVLFGKLRPYLAKAFHADREGICSTEFLVLKPRPDVHPRFLLYAMLSREFVSLVDASTLGAKMPRANWDFIGSMSIPIPSMKIQKRIVNHLDRETTHIDTLITEKEYMLSLLEEKRTAIISQAMTSDLDSDVPLKRICRLEYGDALSKDEKSAGDVPVFGSNGQYATTYESNTKAPVIVLGRKGSYGKVNWSSTEVFASDTTFFVDARFTKANLRWLYWSIQTLRLDEGSQEAAVPGLNREWVYEQRVALPDFERQALIANHLDRETIRIDLLSKEISSTIELLKERRSALITAAITGQIDLEGIVT